MSDLAEIDERLREIQELLARPLVRAGDRGTAAPAGPPSAPGAEASARPPSAPGGRASERPPSERPPSERPPSERPPSERPPSERPPPSGGAGCAPPGAERIVADVRDQLTALRRQIDALLADRDRPGPEPQRAAAGRRPRTASLAGALTLTVAPLSSLDSLERLERGLRAIEGVERASLRTYDSGRATFELRIGPPGESNGAGP
jgi:hypothetical protein